MNQQFKLAERLDGVSESATLKLNARVQEMKAKGEDVVNLTAGEPDFAVNPKIKEAMVEAINANKSKYTPVAGIPELREAIVQKTNRQQENLGRHGKTWAASEVVVSNGGKQAIFNTILALINPGDEVLIPTPYWLSYPEMVKLAGGVPRLIETTFDDSFKLTKKTFSAALDLFPRAKLLILNSPSNPTGAVYSQGEFEVLGQVIESKGRNQPIDPLYVLSDEIYDRILFTDQKFCSFLEANPKLFTQTVTVNGLSKSAAMTGWRVGWSVAVAPITQALITLQGQSTSGICAPAQWAAVKGLQLPESEFSNEVSTFRRRRDLAFESLKKAGKLRVYRCEGAFYLFMEVDQCMRPQEDIMAFAERILVEAKVAVVPGSPFGHDRSIRLSFATDEVSLKKGMDRLVEFVNR